MRFTLSSKKSDDWSKASAKRGNNAFPNLVAAWLQGLLDEYDAAQWLALLVCQSGFPESNRFALSWPNVGAGHDTGRALILNPSLRYVKWLPAKFKAFLKISGAIRVVVSAEERRVAFEIRLLFVLDLHRWSFALR